MKAALLDSNNAVIGEVFDAPETGHRIDVAGAFTAGGDAVNVKSHKISRSKRNLARARYEQPVSRIDTKHGPVWTFRCVENNNVTY